MYGLALNPASRNAYAHHRAGRGDRETSAMGRADAALAIVEGGSMSRISITSTWRAGMTTKPPIDVARSNRAVAAIAFFLNRRARDRPVGAIDAALALDGLHAVAASPAIVNVLTRISRHGLGCAVTAFWTRDDGLQFHCLPPHWDKRSCRLVPVVSPDVSRPKSETDAETAH
jgi:hypothetical protein